MAPLPIVKKELITARVASTLLFYILGINLGTWVSGMPGMKKGFQLNEGQLGLAIMCSGLAALAMALPAGRMVDLMGARFMATSSGVCGPIAYSLLPSMAKTGIAPYIPLFLLNVAAAGGFISCNSRASELEKFWGEPILSSFHAAFSAGGLTGCASYAFLLSHGWDWDAAYPTLFMTTLVMNVIATSIMDKDMPRIREVYQMNNVRVGSEAGTTDGEDHPTTQWLPSPVILLFGGAAIVGYLTEGAVGDWFALYLEQHDNCPYALAPMGYGCFAACMCLSRCAGDSLCRRFGRRTVYGASGCVVLLALTIFLSVSSVPVSLMSCALLGAGMANIEPILISNVGWAAPLNPGTAIATVASMGNGGLLAGPAIIGFVAQEHGLKQGLHLLQMGALVLILASLLITDGERATSKRDSLAASLNLTSEDAFLLDA
eukprot:Blabericola_migrator_1__11336@NODE_66_length_15680_cov_202_244988_g59_i0_p6_GENE_NODE_66_length_15680_cov_202_244988_g59_i0NODE_66_length_15680_cov_202_244988_g59_i0_p6_ORF_typecomplete_len432_score52_49MFS_1/PF07690_16/6_4e17MFS_1/PF07690_16/2e10MFS_4/PF06779_14/2_5e09MFS_2/PF13347_6/5_1MFS_2/PF13347_6/3_5e06MFS_3/PF05977_13/41MFS_3/PF05977_13/0_0033_NODE_66_length_15680_cov_202_244988_g59_i01273214027